MENSRALVLCVIKLNCAGHLNPPSRKAKNKNLELLRSARAAVGSTGTKVGGRSAKLHDHKRNRGRATAAGIKVQVQKFPADHKKTENYYKNNENIQI